MNEPEEISPTKEFIQLVFFGAFILALVLLFGCNPPKKLEGRIFDTSFGQVYCANLWETNCGAWLYNCHDGHEYHCMANVRERGE